MPQTYGSINTGAGGDTVKAGIIALAARTDTLRSSFSGTSFPSGGVVGQHCFRTDLGEEYVLISTGPDVWSKVLRGTLAIADGGTGATTAATARTNLGLGSAAVLNNGTASGELPTIAQADARYLQKSNNLSDLNSASTARTNLGLGALATLATVGAAQIDSGAISTAAKLADGVVTYAKMQAASAASKLIGSPSSGTTLQEITLGTGLAISGGTLSVTSAATNAVARKTADQSVTTSYAAVTDLTVAVGASEVWTVELYLYLTTTVSATVNIRPTYPTSPTSQLAMGFCFPGGSTDYDVITAVGSSLDFVPGATSLGVFRISITLENGSNAGNIGFDIKITSGTVVVKKNSYLVARKH